MGTAVLALHYQNEVLHPEGRIRVGMARDAADRDAVIVTHGRIGAFSGTALHGDLQRLGARRLIVAGVSTTSVVLTTVAQAVDLGYEVTVARDACSAGRQDLHDAALEIMGLVAAVLPVDEALRQAARSGA